MGNLDIGMYLKGVREAAGWTQERLSEGICEVNTLSRIETGAQNPSIELLMKLFDKLEVSDLSLAQQFMDGREGDVVRIQRELIHCLQVKEIDRVPEYLMSLQVFLNRGDTMLQQLYEFCDLAWKSIILFQSGSPIDDVMRRLTVQNTLRQIFWITQPECALEVKGRGQKLWEKKYLSHSEYLSLNAIALVEFCYGKKRLSLQIMSDLLNTSISEPRQDDVAKRRSTTLYLNLASMELLMGFYDICEIHLEKAHGLLYTGGGLQQQIRLYTIYKELYRRSNRMDDYYETECHLRSMYRKLPRTAKEMYYGGRLLILSPDAMFF